MGSASLQMHVEGAQELMSKLRIFEKNVRQRIAMKCIEAAAKPVIADAKRLVPKRFGALRYSIGLKKIKYPSEINVGIIGPRLGFKSAKVVSLGGAALKAEPANYAHLVEFGTKPHALGEGSKRVRTARRRVDGKMVTVELGPGPQKGRMHPGAKENRFLRPAWDHNKGQLLGIMAATLETEMTRELSKSAKR